MEKLNSIISLLCAMLPFQFAQETQLEILLIVITKSDEGRKGYELGSNQRGQRTTSPLVKWTSHPVTANDCNSAIQFSAHFAAPDCVELHDSKRVPYAQILALNAINNVEQWLAAVAAIRR